MIDQESSTLRFNGSTWCNLDIALRAVDQFFRQAIRPEGLKVIEWYILQALYERDGQHASELAQAVGRAATSFTPNLDKLQDKGLIQRRPDEADRRAVRIYLTEAAQAHRADVLASASEIDAHIRRMVPKDDFETFQRVLAILQSSAPD